MIGQNKAKWTPEPWTYWWNGVRGWLLTGHLHSGATSKANAARIVACVNACSGIADPAAELARLRDRIASLEEADENANILIERLRGQRDELLASLRYMVAQADMGQPRDLRAGSGYHAARAAIAKAEGQS